MSEKAKEYQALIREVLGCNSCDKTRTNKRCDFFIKKLKESETCGCGHSIKNQFQIIVNGVKKFDSVGSTCILAVPCIETFLSMKRSIIINEKDMAVDIKKSLQSYVRLVTTPNTVKRVVRKRSIYGSRW